MLQSAGNGSVSGGGMIYEGDTIPYDVSPDEGYEFDHWEPSAPGKATGDATYTAYFKLKPADPDPENPGGGE